MKKYKRFALILLTAVLLLCVAIPAIFAAEAQTTLVQTGKTMWRYYVTDTQGFSQMDADWYTVGYDVSSWKRGVSPFGDRLSGGTHTGWEGDDHGIFLVTTFTVDTIPQDAKLRFEMFFDDNIKIYLNENLLFEHATWNDAIESFEFSTEYLVAGENTLAVSLCDDHGGREFDLTASLVYTSDDVEETTKVEKPEVGDTPLISKSETLWQYLVTTTDAFKQMDASWNTAAFDRSSWQTKIAPFGDIIDGSCDDLTGWKGDNHGLFLVTTFDIADPEAAEKMYYYMDVFYDNTVTFYLNGTELVHYDGWNTSFEIITFDPAVFTAALVEGKNTFAVSLLDDAGGREFSMSLYMTDTVMIPDTVVTKEELEMAGLPIIRIDTDDGDYVKSRLDYVDATMVFDNMDSYPFEDNMYTADGGAAIEIRGRGNSTWNNGYADGKENTLAGDTHTRKVGYNIKLEEKTDLFGMGESKKWVLLANYMDRSNLRNRLVADLSGRMGMIYTQSVYVNLVLNGEYMGIYALTEKVDIDLFEGAVTDFEDYAEDLAKAIAKEKGYDKDWRSDMEDELCENLSWLTEEVYVAKDGAEYTVSDYIDLSEVSTETGFLIEYDGYADEDSFFRTSHNAPLKVSNLEYIKSNPTVYNDLVQYFEDFEEALFSDTFYNAKGKHYSEYVDMTSFVDCFILNTLILNVEFGYKSMYMSIGEDGKIYLGPTWDYDWSSGNRFLGANGDYDEWYNDNRAANNVWYRQAYGDPWFVSLVKERWATLDDAVNDMIDSMTYYEEYLYPSTEIEYRKFAADPYETDFDSRTGGRSFAEEVAQLRTFLINRKDWMDEQLVLRDPNIEGFGFISQNMLLQLVGDGVTVRADMFDYATTLTEGNVTLQVALDAVSAKVYINGILQNEIESADIVEQYAETAIDLSTLEKGVNTVTVLGFGENGTLVAQSYLTLTMPGEKQESPTSGSFLPDIYDPNDPVKELSTDTLDAYVQLKNSANGTVALRTVFVGDLTFLNGFDSLSIVITFQTTEGNKELTGTLGKGSDYTLFQNIYAKGDRYVASEGDYLFGNEVYDIPAGILETVTATVTAPNGTVVYTGTADLR